MSRFFQKLHKLSLRQKITIVAVCAIVLVVGYLAFSGPTVQEKLALNYLDNLSASSLSKEVKSDYDDTYAIEDYTIYGQNLSLETSAYEHLENDALFGRNVVLHNIETDENNTFTFTGAADSGIDLSVLKPGVYEVFVYDGYTPKRVMMNEEFHMEPFTTTRNNKSVNTINMDADKEFLQKFGLASEDNYLFITVTESLPKVKIADVVLDPSGLLETEYGAAVDDYVLDGFNEKDASWSLAEKIKAILEEGGLRVIMSRTENDSASYAGPNSRVGVGYEAQAKLFVSLAVGDAEADRPYVMSSAYTNANLANCVTEALQKDGAELSAIARSSSINQYNLYDDVLGDGYGSLLPYTAEPALRESGGKVTAAGTLAGFEPNEKYAQANGMNALVVCYASKESPESVSYFQSHEDVIAKGIADGILKYCKIENEGENQ